MKHSTNNLGNLLYIIIFSLPLFYGCPPENLCPTDQDYFDIYTLKPFQIKVSNTHGFLLNVQSKYIRHMNTHSIHCPLDQDHKEMNYEIIQGDSSYGVFSINYQFKEQTCENESFKQVETASIINGSTFLNLYTRMYGQNGQIITEGRIDSVGQNIAQHLNNLYAKLN